MSPSDEMLMACIETQKMFRAVYYGGVEVVVGKNGSDWSIKRFKNGVERADIFFPVFLQPIHVAHFETMAYADDVLVDAAVQGLAGESSEQYNSYNLVFKVIKLFGGPINRILRVEKLCTDI